MTLMLYCLNTNPSTVQVWWNQSKLRSLCVLVRSWSWALRRTLPLNICCLWLWEVKSIMYVPGLNLRACQWRDRWIVCWTKPWIATSWEGFGRVGSHGSEPHWLCVRIKLRSCLSVPGFNTLMSSEEYSLIIWCCFVKLVSMVKS